MTIFLTNILGIGTLITSLFAIVSINPVIGVIFLIATFVQAAGYLILIGINFIGISYIVIYVGAIAVLFLFVIMMINIKLTDIIETGNQYTKNKPLAIAIGCLYVFIIFSLIPYNFNNIPAILSLTSLNQFLLNDFNSIEFINLIINLYNNPSFSDLIINDYEQMEVLGHGLYTYGAVLLIVLSVILLLAMLAAIVISKSNK